MARTVKITVTTGTRDAVDRLRSQTGESASVVIDRALAAYAESVFWDRWREADHVVEPDLALWDAASTHDL